MEDEDLTKVFLGGPQRRGRVLVLPGLHCFLVSFGLSWDDGLLRGFPATVIPWHVSGLCKAVLTETPPENIELVGLRVIKPKYSS